MALRTQHPAATAALSTHLSAAGLAGHLVSRAGAGDGDDVLKDHQAPLKLLDVTVPLGQTWSNGDHVYRLKGSGTWAKWDTIATGLAPDVSGVVMTVVGGNAVVVVNGRLVAANITNLTAAKSAGLHVAQLVAV